MGFFDQPSAEEKQQKTVEVQAAMEKKVRTKAANKGFDVTSAIYVLEAFVPKEDKKNAVSRPFVAIYADRVVQSRKSIFNPSHEEVPLDRISSVEITTGLIPSVNVYTNGNILTFRTDSLQGPRFVEVLRIELSKQKRKSPSSAITDVEQLEKLAALLDKGLLTTKEFEAKKKQILGL